MISEVSYCRVLYRSRKHQSVQADDLRAVDGHREVVL